MVNKLIWENLTPRQKAELEQRIVETGIYEIRNNHVEVRGREEMQGFPKPNQKHTACVGYIGPYPKINAAVLTNTEFFEKTDYELYSSYLESIMEDTKGELEHGKR